MLNDQFAEKDGGYRRRRSHVATASSEWVVVDAAGKTLGRLASQVAAILRGKHKPTFTPNVNMGDNVIVINAERIRITGRKREQKLYRRHTSYMGGLRSVMLDEMLERDPADVVRRAIVGMLPHTSLGDDMRTRIRVYAGSQHPHEAQTPRTVEVGE
ncbi:50S ribosomal protein L13 [Candidatus Poribacteria bacterium]|nr:50S ribosomal protein L13 [Candidatus Poribacteria bacterium]